MTARLFSIPGSHYLTGPVAAEVAATASGAVGSPIYVPDACRLLGFAFVPATTQAGADTNSANLNLINAGTDGLGTTEVANLDLGAGVTLTALDAKVVTLATPVNIAAGSVLYLKREKVGTGLNTPAGQLSLIVDGGYAGL